MSAFDPKRTPKLGYASGAFGVRYYETLDFFRKASIRRSGVSDIQDAIGQCLCEQYAPERSMPARLANLLREFEQRSNKLKHLLETTMRARVE